MELHSPVTALEETQRYWADWSGRLRYQGDYRAEILRSILILKLLTFAPTGAIVAAPTTSLPEVIGGRRNWDYRLSWIRDSQFVLTAFMHCGYFEEAHGFFQFLKEAANGPVDQLQILYDIRGERAERRDGAELPGGLSPFAAGTRRQCRRSARSNPTFSVNCSTACTSIAKWLAPRPRKRSAPMKCGRWRRTIADYVVRHWREPDQGIWESRKHRPTLRPLESHVLDGARQGHQAGRRLSIETTK